VTKQPAGSKTFKNAKDMWHYDDKKFTEMIIEKSLGGELEINRQLEEDKK
jgi:hypothetical protein